MKNIFLILLLLSIHFSAFALSIDELKAYYNQADKYIEDNIAYITLVQSGSVWEFYYISITTDYLDSIYVDIKYFNRYDNDTLYSSTVIHRNSKIAEVKTDMINTDSENIVLEDYSLYRGHNFTDMISDSCSLSKMDNSNYIIRNWSDNAVLDSIYISSSKLPYRLFSTENGSLFIFNINDYKSTGSLHIPSSVILICDTDTIFSIEETSLSIGWK